MARVAPDATAFSQRQPPYLINCITRTPTTDGFAAHRAWARGTRDAMAQFGAGRTYVNFTGEDDHDNTRAAYPAQNSGPADRGQATLRPRQPVPLHPQHLPGPGPATGVSAPRGTQHRCGHGRHSPVSVSRQCRWPRIALCWPRSAAVDNSEYGTSRWQTRQGTARTEASGTRWTSTRSRSATGSGCSTSPAATTTSPTCGCCARWTGCARCTTSRRTPTTSPPRWPSWPGCTTTCPTLDDSAARAGSTRWPTTEILHRLRGRVAGRQPGPLPQPPVGLPVQRARLPGVHRRRGRARAPASGTPTCPGWSSPTSSRTSARSPRPTGRGDAEQVYRRLSRLDTVLDDMSRRAAQFHLTLGEIMRSTDTSPETFLRYKNALLTHMTDFMAELDRYLPPARPRPMHEPSTDTGLTHAARPRRRGRRPAVPVRRRASATTGAAAGPRCASLVRRRRPRRRRAPAEGLRTATRAAVSAVIALLRQVTEAQRGGVNRSSQLRHLAEWVFGTPDEPAAHALMSAGVQPALGPPPRRRARRRRADLRPRDLVGRARRGASRSRLFRRGKAPTPGVPQPARTNPGVKAALRRRQAERARRRARGRRTRCSAAGAHDRVLDEAETRVLLRLLTLRHRGPHGRRRPPRDRGRAATTC